MTSILQLLVAAFIIFPTAFVLYMKWLRTKYPPGPWPLPIVGNLDLFTSDPTLALLKLTKRYGPVFTFWMGSRPTIVLNSLEAFKEATGEKGFKFAGKTLNHRGFYIMFNEGEDLVTRPYNRKVDKMRRLGLSIIKTQSIGGFSIRKIVLEEVKTLLKIIQKFEGKLVDPFDVLNIPISNTVMRSVISLKFEDEEDSKFVQWTNLLKKFESALPSAVLLEVCPILWYIVPGMKRMFERLAKPFDEFIEQYVVYHAETYEEGKIRDLTDVMIKELRNQDEETPSYLRLTEKSIVAMLKDMFGAAAETTNSTIRSCILALLYRPDIKKKICQELDEYVSKQIKSNNEEGCTETIKSIRREQFTFDLDDRPFLPYINAFIHEVMRRCTVSGFATLHSTMENTSVSGYPICKDTAVLLNLHAIHVDERQWDKPFDIIPERFLDGNGNFDKGKAQLLVPFSAGPRRCIGENLARMELHIFLSNMLYWYDLCCPSVEELPGLDDVEFGLSRKLVVYKMIFERRRK